MGLVTEEPVAVVAVVGARVVAGFVGEDEAQHAELSAVVVWARRQARKMSHSAKRQALASPGPESRWGPVAVLTPTRQRPRELTFPNP